MTETIAERPQEQAEFDFSCDYSVGLPQLLARLNISLAFTSYQAGRLMLVRSDGTELDVNFKQFHRPMGLTCTGDELTLGVFNQVINFRREDALVSRLKAPLDPIEHDITAPRLKSPENAVKAVKNPRLEQRHHSVDARVDSCFITRSSHYSGMINIHDVEWGNDCLWAVNSSFSCLCTFDPDYSFVPRWKPYFISELAPEDRCHLNGMTLRDGEPAFVTTFSTFDQPGMWRKGDKFTGALMGVKANEILVDGLCMPHSPRFYRESVYFCNSGLGEVRRYCEKTGAVSTVAELPGFSRGMDFYGDLMVVGLSKVRQSDVTRPAPLAQKYSKTESGLAFIDLRTNKLIGSLYFSGNVDQIYDVAVIPDSIFPEIIEPSNPRLRNHFTHPPLSEI